MIANILPPNSTPYEFALDDIGTAIDTLDVLSIVRMRDPYQTPPGHLPFLAWGRGVDLWYEDWTLSRKRRITAEIFKLKQKKGTLRGIEGYLEYVDAKVVESILPPASVVARPYSPARLKEYRERFAEVRLFQFRQRGHRPGFVPGSKACAARSGVARPNGAAQFYGRQAVLVDKGVETVLRSIDQIVVRGSDVAVSTDTFALPVAGRYNDAVPGRYRPGIAIARKPRGRLLVLGGGGLQHADLAFGFERAEVLSLTPEKVARRHGASSWQPIAAAQPRVGPPGRIIARLDEASAHLFSSWRILDRDRAGFEAYRALGPVVGRMVPGLEPHHALLRIDATFRLRGRTAVVSRAVAGRAVARPPSDRIQRVGAAIYVAKAVHDDVHFTTRTYRPRTLADLSFDRPVPFNGMVPILRSSVA